MRIANRLWEDQNGFIVSSELVLLASVILIPLLVGMQTVRDSVVQELGDVGQGVGNLVQSYWYAGVAGHHSYASGSQFVDLPDQCEGNWCNHRNCLSVGIGFDQENCGGGSLAYNGGVAGPRNGGNKPLIWESGIQPGPPIVYEPPAPGVPKVIPPVPEPPTEQ